MLARVEKKLAGEPVLFIGVHSPKFPNERDLAMVREAVRRYGVTHPVVVDSGHRIWSSYAVSGWPTLAVVDPFGYVLGNAPGEPDAAELEGTLRQLLAEYRAKGAKLDARPLPLRPEPNPEGSLSYPGKVLAARDRLFVADTGHHQIVECALEGDGRARELRRFGDGVPAPKDGAANSAPFSHPNGLALDDAAGALYVADTGNHCVRRVELSSGEVTTVAGTGEMAPVGVGEGAARDVALRSPWDVAFDAQRGLLYVAMAGSHQLFTVELATGRLEVLAGSGREMCIDGPLREAAFAQPSGLALSGDLLFVADAEVSSIREVDLAAGRVRTLAGSADLFDWGDQDGVGEGARFQHPIGVCVDGGAVLVADSFNHRVRRIDRASGEVTTLYGSAEPSHANLLDDARQPSVPAIADARTPLFFEPEGLSVAGGWLYVADTNNHRVLAIEKATRRVVRSL